jgi:hypothetical protein
METEQKQASNKTQLVYSQDNFELLLSKFPTYKSVNAQVKIVESLRNLAEFICYSEQYKLNYFDLLMSTDVLLVDMPRLL